MEMTTTRERDTYTKIAGGLGYIVIIPSVPAVNYSNPYLTSFDPP